MFHCRRMLRDWSIFYTIISLLDRGVFYFYLWLLLLFPLFLITRLSWRTLFLLFFRLFFFLFFFLSLFLLILLCLLLLHTLFLSSSEVIPNSLASLNKHLIVVLLFIVPIIRKNKLKARASIDDQPLMVNPIFMLIHSYLLSFFLSHLNNFTCHDPFSILFVLLSDDFLSFGLWDL